MRWDGNNYYFSGQGVVLIGKRTSEGKPAGLRPVGNCSDLKISIATSVLEHKESQTGQRGIDLRLTTETKGTLSVTLENFTAEQLALALRGDLTIKAGSTVSNEDINLYPGSVSPLVYAMVSSVTLDIGVKYVNDETDWDYKLNEDAGSVLVNRDYDTADDLVDPSKVAATCTDITVGATTTLVLTNSTFKAFGIKVGDKAYFSNFAGADAADINNMSAAINSITPGETDTTIVVAFNTAGKTITDNTNAAKVVFWPSESNLDFYVATEVDYTYAAQNIVDALTQGSQERYLRFEGLNTADESRPCVVEVFKFLVDPLKDLSLISDAIGQFVLEGNVLADQLQTGSGSKYFRQTLVR